MTMNGLGESSVHFQPKDECTKMIGQTDGNKTQTDGQKDRVSETVMILT